MVRTRTYFLSLAVCLLASVHAYSQGTPAVLRCIFKGSVELRATLDPSSPIITRIPCGASIVLMDRRASSPHVRTKDGKDGYIISFNGGQWSLQPETETSTGGVTATAGPSHGEDPTPNEPSALQPQQKPSLTNTDILELVYAGVSSEVIVAVIESSATNFDLAPAALAYLKMMNVADNVVLAMVRSGSPPPAPKAANDHNRSIEDLTEIFRQLQTSVLTVWSEFGHGTGFVIDRSGLILTNQHIVGPSVYIAVQSDTTHKTAATLLAASAEKDIAVLWANLDALPGITVASLPETKDAVSPIVEGGRILTIGVPLTQRKVMTTGVIRKVESRTIVADININPENTGGPLITSSGEIIGITSMADSGTYRRASGIIRIEEAEPLLADAHALISQLPNPAAVSLPVDPIDAFPVDDVREAALADKFDTKSYSVAMGDFELFLITPTLKYRMQTAKPLEGYAGWTDYISEYRPVLQIQVTPENGDSLWNAFNRSLSKSGVVASPPKQRFKSDFYGMRILCGGKEIAPIHPGKVPHLINPNGAFLSTRDANYEGLYSYPADAISPACGQVRIEVTGEKNRDKPIVKVLDNKVVERIAEDFAPYLRRR